MAEPPDLHCPVTLALFRDPVVVANGNCYERGAVQAAWAARGHAFDPLTNARLASDVLLPNQVVRRQVRAFLDAHPAHVPRGWASRDEVPPLQSQGLAAADEDDDAPSSSSSSEDEEEAEEDAAVWAAGLPAALRDDIAQQLRVRGGRELDARTENFGDAAAVALAGALRGNTTLVSLGLHWCAVGDAGAAALADALRANDTLRELSYRWRPSGVECARVGDAGAAAFADALRVNNVLRGLTLSDAAVGDAGACAARAGACGAGVNTAAAVDATLYLAAQVPPRWPGRCTATRRYAGCSFAGTRSATRAPQRWPTRCAPTARSRRCASATPPSTAAVPRRWPRRCAATAR